MFFFHIYGRVAVLTLASFKCTLNHCTSSLSSRTRNTFCGTWYLPHSHVHN